MRRTGVAVVALLSVASAGTVHATDLFSPTAFNAWADIRAVSADGEKSWRDDGFGKLRYGDESKIDLAQAALLWKPHLTDTISAYVLAEDVPDAEHAFGFEEAYIKWKPLPVMTPAGLYHFTFRAGQMFPPVSMEHDGVGWTPSRTLTPSAINTWVGEELVVQGGEAAVTAQYGETQVGLTLGAFTKDDTAGTILAWRGWALHDISSGSSTELPLPSGPQGYTKLFGPYQAYESRPLDEVDHRLGYYGRLDWRPPAPVAFNLEYYNNQGNPLTVRNGQWGWGTAFWNLGAEYTLDDRDVLISQYMTGGTKTGGIVTGTPYHAVDLDFDSGYLMLSHDLGSGAKLTGRIDYFGAKDLSLRAIDDNAEKGYAATLAWLKPLTPHIDFGLEGLSVFSHRPARATQGLDPHQSQTQLQMAFKFHL